MARLSTGLVLIYCEMLVFLTMLAKPFVALVIFGLICLPARLAVQKMPDCKLKRLLLIRVK